MDARSHRQAPEYSIRQRIGDAHKIAAGELLGARSRRDAQRGYSIVETGTILRIFPTASLGLIQIVAPAGKYRLRLAMAPLQEERLGAVFSGLAALLLLGRTTWLFRRRRVQNKMSLYEISSIR